MEDRLAFPTLFSLFWRSLTASVTRATYRSGKESIFMVTFAAALFGDRCKTVITHRITCCYSKLISISHPFGCALTCRVGWFSRSAGCAYLPGRTTSRVDEVPKDQYIVVICHSGNRSQVGYDTLYRILLQRRWWHKYLGSGWISHKVNWKWSARFR